MRFDLQKVFGDSIDDNNAKKLFQRSLTLPGVNEFQFVNFLSSSLHLRLLLFYQIKIVTLLSKEANSRQFCTCHKLPDIFLHILSSADHGLAEFLQ